MYAIGTARPGWRCGLPCSPSLSLRAWMSRNILSAFLCISLERRDGNYPDVVRGSCASLSLSGCSCVGRRAERSFGLRGRSSRAAGLLNTRHPSLGLVGDFTPSLSDIRSFTHRDTAGEDRQTTRPPSVSSFFASAVEILCAVEAGCVCVCVGCSSYLETRVA